MQSHAFDSGRIEYVGEQFVIYDISDLIPRHANFPYGTEVEKPNGKRAIPASWHYKHVPDRKVDTLYCHQTAGAVTYSGFAAVMNTFAFMQREPGYTTAGKWTGRGRGWPAGCYTFYVPYRPWGHEEKVVIFRCWDDDWVTWHSSHNAHAIAIVFQGYFRHRSMRRFHPRKGCLDGKPSFDQRDALDSFIREYAIGLMGLAPQNIKGHCDSPKPKVACPGDDTEKIYRPYNQGIIAVDTIEVELPSLVRPLLPEMPGMLELNTWRERQAALVMLGHNIGKYGRKKNGVDGDPGYLTRAAIETEEENLGLTVDGRWDDTIDYHIRIQLLARHKTQADVDSFI